MEKQKEMEEQRNKAALDRALAPPYRPEGRRPVFRSKPLKKKIQNSSEELQEEDFIVSLVFIQNKLITTVTRLETIRQRRLDWVVMCRLVEELQRSVWLHQQQLRSSLLESQQVSGTATRKHPEHRSQTLAVVKTSIYPQTSEQLYVISSPVRRNKSTVLVELSSFFVNFETSCVHTALHASTLKIETIVETVGQRQSWLDIDFRYKQQLQ